MSPKKSSDVAGLGANPTDIWRYAGMHPKKAKAEQGSQKLAKALGGGWNPFVYHFSELVEGFVAEARNEEQGVTISFATNISGKFAVYRYDTSKGASFHEWANSPEEALAIANRHATDTPEKAVPPFRSRARNVLRRRPNSL